MQVDLDTLCSFLGYVGNYNTIFELDNDPLLSNSSQLQPHFALRAQLLYNECVRLRDTGPCHTAYSTGVADPDDSGDEQVPGDPAIDAELVVVNYLYTSLWDSFQMARMKNFQNAAGKLFFTDFGKFLMMVHPATNHWQYRSVHSTNSSGPAQPGALEVIHTDPLSYKSSGPKTRTHQEQVADYVV